MSTLDSKLEVPQRSLSPRARASLKQLQQRMGAELTADGSLVVVTSMGRAERWERISKDTYELSEVV